MVVMHFISGIKSGGVEQMLINYTKYINEHSNVNEYIIYQHKPNLVCLNKLKKSGNKCIQIHNKRTHPIKNIEDTFRLILKYHPDILHAHMSLVNFIPLFIGFICGIKIRISHSHIAHINIKSKIAEKFFKFLNILFANVLFACGEKAGKYMYGNHKFKVIPNCIYVSKFCFDRENRINIRHKLGVKKNEILLGTIGRLTKQKNQIFLLKLLRQLLKRNRKYKLLIIGSGFYKKLLNNFSNKYNLNNNFILHKPVYDIEKYYSAMDIFLLPSLYEGFPISLIEAQSSGIDTIAASNIDKSVRINHNIKFASIKIDTWLRLISNISLGYNRYINLALFRNYNLKYNYNYLFRIYNQLINNYIKK